MPYLTRLTLLVTFLALLSSICAMGCGPEDQTGPSDPTSRDVDPSSDTGSDVPAEAPDGSGGRDAGAADGSADTAEGADVAEMRDTNGGGDVSCVPEDGGTCRCNFRGLEAGVCRDLEADGDGGCPKPEDWESTESSCDGLDNDCDGAADEGCSCDYRGFSGGVCQNQTRDDTGHCPQPDLYQGTESRCDERDNDCDGAVDEGCACSRGDGKTGVCAAAGTLDDGGRCAVPGWERVESSCDRRDNDCDGAVDESCECDFKNKSDGVCAGLTRDTQGTCPEPAGWEATESSCDNRDNDCDGAADEGCGCDYRGQAAGVCKDQTRTNRGVCPQPALYEANELRCDDKDNDCDGTVDEGCTCTVGDGTTGVCANTGTKTPAGRCQVAGYEKDESSCDARDNDCDGSVDEGCPCNYLLKQQGVCLRQTRDSSGNCPVPSDYQAAESKCDGKDNDCDGAADEGCACDYRGKKTGVCTQLTRDNGGSCPQPDAYQAVEVKCDGLDNDCDGATDEGCACNYNNQAEGVCKGLTRDKSGSCPTPPTWESPTNSEAACDGKDNDCDGVTDEGCACHYNGIKKGACQGLSRGTDGKCPTPSAYETPEASCDQVDNDCDGYVDENNLKEIYVGVGYKCGLDDSGKAFCWGDNTWGQLGDGSTQTHSSPHPVLTSQRFVELTAGRTHTCGRTKSNEVYCWGDNSWGQLGDGTQTAQFAPTKVKSGGVKFTDIAAVSGREISYTPASRTYTKDIGSATAAIAEDGTIYWWGYRQHKRDYAPPPNYGCRGNLKVFWKRPKKLQTSYRATEIGGGTYKACARTTSGRALCFGSEEGGYSSSCREYVNNWRLSFQSKISYNSLSVGRRTICGQTGTKSFECWRICGGGCKRSNLKPRTQTTSAPIEAISINSRTPQRTDSEPSVAVDYLTDKGRLYTQKWGTCDPSCRRYECRAGLLKCYPWSTQPIHKNKRLSTLSTGGDDACGILKSRGDAFCVAKGQQLACF